MPRKMSFQEPLSPRFTGETGKGVSKLVRFHIESTKIDCRTQTFERTRLNMDLEN